MRAKQEKLGMRAAVKGTMMQAHLSWAEANIEGARARLATRMGPECGQFLAHTFLATDWIPLRCLIALDRAAAAEAGGSADAVYLRLGEHSAQLNLGGVYKYFVQDEPHRFFEQMTLLHSRFQNFGRSSYERLGPSAGRIRLEGYDEYSPVFCGSALGYYHAALVLMKVPGPVRVVETTCQCAGEVACVYELTW